MNHVKEEILEVHLEPDLNNIKTEYPEGENNIICAKEECLEVKLEFPETISRGKEYFL